MLARGLLLVTLSAPLAFLPFAVSSARAETGPVISKANSSPVTKSDYWSFPLLPLTSSGPDSGECKGGGGGSLVLVAPLQVVPVLALQVVQPLVVRVPLRVVPLVAAVPVPVLEELVPKVAWVHSAQAPTM
jgi:hypothetical protein